MTHTTESMTQGPPTVLQIVQEAIRDHDRMIERSGYPPSDFNRGYRAALIDTHLLLQRGRP